MLMKIILNMAKRPKSQELNTKIKRKKNSKKERLMAKVGKKVRIDLARMDLTRMKVKIKIEPT